MTITTTLEKTAKNTVAALRGRGKGPGSFFALTADIFVTAARTPFAWREFILQCWFVTRVSLVPAVAMAVPLNMFITMLFNAVLLSIGAGDLAGAVMGITAIQDLGPVAAVFVISGAAATAMCADLGARTIREEIDAMESMGLDPVRTLLVPRVAAVTLVALYLVAVCQVSALASAYWFSVYVQDISPGAIAASFTTMVGFRGLVIVGVKSLLFGLVAGLIACYKGVTVSGGPQGVGNAVNETVVYALIWLSAIEALAAAFNAKVVYTL